MDSTSAFEDILRDVGDFGSYQRFLLWLFLFPTGILIPWLNLSILFMLSVPDHWCHVPEVITSNLTMEQQHRIIRPPSDPRCSMYDVNYTDVLFSVHSNNTDWEAIHKWPTRTCDRGWQYNQTYYEETASSLWNMVCSDSHYTSLILTLANVGSIIGTPLYGLLSDRVGRKPTFFVTVLVTTVTAIVSVLMNNFTAFLVLRTINGSLMPSIFQLPYIILLEIVGPTMRTKMNGIANTSWTFGLCFLPLIAWLTRHWVTLGLVTSSVTVLFFVYWKILPESPRWLVSQERYKEAADVMTTISRRNGKTIHETDELLLQLKKLGERMKREKMNDISNSPMDFLRYPQLRKKFLIVTFCWVADITAYYGLQINVSHLGGNEFVNFFLLALVEVPGYLCSWIFMERFGRRWCSVCALILTGIACLLPGILPENLPSMGVVASLLGKFGASAAFMAVYQQSAELYPTTVRALGMGLSSTVAAIVTIAVPYIVHLAVYGKFIPFLIISFICILSGIAAAFLPETLNENLPQTISDAEHFGKSQRFFSCNRRRRPSCHEERPPHPVTVPIVEMEGY